MATDDKLNKILDEFKALMAAVESLPEVLLQRLDGTLAGSRGAIEAAFGASSGPSFVRMTVDDPGNPGGCDAYGGHIWNPDTRWETDAEFRERIKASLASHPRERDLDAVEKAFFERKLHSSCMLMNERGQECLVDRDEHEGKPHRFPGDPEH